MLPASMFMRIVQETLTTEVSLNTSAGVTYNVDLTVEDDIEQQVPEFNDVVFVVQPDGMQFGTVEEVYDLNAGLIYVEEWEEVDDSDDTIKLY